MDNYADLDFAKLDLTREERTGFPEVVFCSGKEDEFLLKIFERLYNENQEVFGTRATKEQYELIARKFQDAAYDPVSKILKIEKKEEKTRVGNIAVCTAGTADISDRLP